MIPFIDLQAQRARISDRIDAAVSKVIRSGAYIFGPEVKTLEGQLAQFAGCVDHVLLFSNEKLGAPELVAERIRGEVRVHAAGSLPKAERALKLI